MAKFRFGDYVLATQNKSGHPGEDWAIGLFNKTDEKGKYHLVDREEKDLSFRGHGFSRCERVTFEVGELILKYRWLVEHCHKSLWWWKKNILSENAKGHLFYTMKEE